ncbi:hypothetical protein Tco_1486918 [Tanacetum coccineum]
MEDRWTWTLDGMGTFNMKSARVAIDKKLLITGINVTRWNRWTWTLDGMGLLVGITRVNLDARGIDVPSVLCPVVGYSYSRDEMLSTMVRLVLGSSVKYGAKTVFGGNVLVGMVACVVS